MDRNKMLAGLLNPAFLGGNRPQPTPGMRLQDSPYDWGAGDISSDPSGRMEDRLEYNTANKMAREERSGQMLSDHIRRMREADVMASSAGTDEERTKWQGVADFYRESMGAIFGSSKDDI